MPDGEDLKEEEEEIPEEGGEEQEPSESTQRAEGYGREAARPKEKEEAPAKEEAPGETPSGKPEGEKPTMDKTGEAKEGEKPESKYSRFRRGTDIARHPVSYAKGYGKQKARQAVGKAAKKAAEAASKIAARVGTAALDALGVATSETWVPIVIGIVVLIFGIIIIVVLILIILWLLQGGGGQSAKMDAGGPNGANKALYAEMKTMVDRGQIVAPDKSPEPNNSDVPSEKEFLLGKASPKAGNIDARLLRSLIYLAKKHQRIYVSHIIYPYVYMPINSIETKNTKDEKFIKSISAHKDGKAADISEIDCVYPPSTAHQSYCKNGKPIQVVMQDDPVNTGAEDQGVSREQGIALLEQSMGLPAGSLTGNSLEEILSSAGRSELESYLKLDVGSLDGENLSQIIDKLGLTKLNQQLGIPTETTGTNLDQILLDAGRSKMEEILQIPKNGFNGQDLRSIAFNLGQTKIERELGMPTGSLKDKTALEMYIKNHWGWQGSNQQAEMEKSLKEAATNLYLPNNTFVDIFAKARAGQDFSDDLRSIGTEVLAISFGFPPSAPSVENIFDQIIKNPSTVGFEIPYDTEIQNKFWTRISEIERENDFPTGSLKNLLDTLTRGENSKDQLQQIASQIIGDNLGFAPEDIFKIVKQQTSLDAVLIKAGLTKEDIAARLGISTEAIQKLLDADINTGDLIKAVRETGQLYLSTELNLPYGVFGDLINGKVDFNTFVQLSGVDLTKTAEDWGLPSDTLTDLISGNPKKAFENIGYDLFGENLGISRDQFSTAINLITTGDLKGAVKQFATNYALAAIEAYFGLPTGAITLIMMAIEDPAAFINMLVLGPLGMVSNIFGAVSDILGGLFGSGCDARCQARNKVHLVIKELMQMPSSKDSALGLPDLIGMRIMQLITWSYDRDVLPFETGEEKPSYKDVYGQKTISNYGLFATSENNYLLDHIHIGY